MPLAPENTPEVDVLVDEVALRFRDARTVADRAEQLRALFLVLPEVPAVQPDWLDAFDRSIVSPTAADIGILLTTLEQARPVRFQRLNAAGQGLNVAVRPNDQNALPIAPQHLRRAFADVVDQWAADVGNANGRLPGGNLDLPPEDFLFDLFLLGPERIRQLFRRNLLTAHEVWPFIAAALSQAGTERPHWFLAGLTDDVGQLVGQLRRAFDVARNPLLARRQATLESYSALRDAHPLGPLSELRNFVRDGYKTANAAKERLAASTIRSRETARAVPIDAEVRLIQVSSGEVNAGQGYVPVLAVENRAAARYWARLLAECATDLDDREMLVDILRREELRQAWTAARKALRLIDAISFGPQIELE